MAQLLAPNTFRTVVEHSPLISIDLVVNDGAGKYLLGLRNNRPAQGCWFVPGGRILKNETMDAAFQRLTEVELGLCYSRQQAAMLGVYEHLYADNFSGSDFSTHYIVLGYRLKLALSEVLLPRDQHRDYLWLTPAEILQHPDVHENSKAYFR
jgi:colanic acid biosynthesis protein WcaH